MTCDSDCDRINGEQETTHGYQSTIRSSDSTTGDDTDGFPLIHVPGATVTSAPFPATMGFGMLQPSAAAAAPPPEPIDASTPWVAAADGDLALLEASLRARGLSAAAADDNGYTLLQAAASYGQLEAMRWLLAQEPPPPVDAVDREGDSALHYAASAAACRLLVSTGIDRGIRNQAGRTALEAKREELQELMEEEDFDEDDVDAAALRECTDYLSQL